MKRLFSLFSIVVLVFLVSMPVTAQRGAKVVKRPVIQTEKAIRFSSVEAFSEGNGAFVRWQMEVETDNVGFFVYRITSGGEKLASDRVILGSKARNRDETTYGGEYSYFDPAGMIGDVYVIESLDANGRRVTSSKAGVGYVYELSSITGRSTEDLLSSYGSKMPRYATNSLVLPKPLYNEIRASQITPDPIMQRTIAAMPGVKLGIKYDGFYRVAKSQLQGAGFDVTADPATWQLYCDGVEQAIVIGPNGDYVEFIAQAKETAQTDLRYYYLVAGGTAGKRMQTAVSRPDGIVVQSKNYYQSSFAKERIYYVSDILTGGGENFWGSLISSSSAAKFNFNLTGIDTLAGTATVNVRLQGFSTTAHSVTLLLNGHALDVVAGTDTNAFGTVVTVPVSYLTEGANTLSMTTAASGDYVFFDTITVSYARQFLAYQDQVSFYTTSRRATTVTGFSTPYIRLFDTTLDGQPVEILNLKTTQSRNVYNLDLPGNRGRRLLATADTAARSIATIEYNNPSTLSTPGHAASLVIISYPDFIQQANTWATYRRNQGLSVEVIDVRDIYDEFGYGQSGAGSIKSFLAYAVGNWNTPPHYALLLGDATYDPKNYEGGNFINYIPTVLVDTVYMETGSDEALADFNGDGLAEVAIGRIPALNSQDVTNAYGKVVGFEQPANLSLNRGAIFAYDLPIGYDFAGMSATLRNNLPNSMPAIMVDRGAANSSATLVSEINNGRYIVNYSGHGTATSWAVSSFFGYLQVPTLTNTTNQSIFTMLTCLNGYFINPNTDSLAERLLKANGGSVVAWASSGKTTADVQMIMANRFYSQLAAGNTPRIGDLIMDAKSVIPGGTDVRYSWVLIGDPVLKVR